MQKLLNQTLTDLENHKNILFKDASIASANHNWQNGHIYIENHKLKQITQDEPKLIAADTLILDASDFLISPSFINAHTHVAMNMFRDLAHQTDNMIQNLFFPWEKKIDPQIIAALSYPYILSGLLSGVTVFADHYYHEKNIIEAFKSFGVKALVGETVADIGSALPSIERWNENKEWISNWDLDRDYFLPVVAPHATDSNSMELLKDMVKFAEDNQLPLHMHLSQTQKEREFTLNNHSLTPVQMAEICGALGPKTVAVHLVSADKKDLQLIKDSGTTFGLSASSEIIYENLPDLKTILELDIPFVIGTDCAASNDSADILSEMKTTYLLCQEHGYCENLTQKILNSTTQKAAKAFGCESWSNLEVEADADLVFFYKSLDTLPLQVPQENLLFSHSNHSLKHVMVRGEWTLYNQKPVKIDLEAATQEFKKALASFKQAIA